MAYSLLNPISIINNVWTSVSARFYHKCFCDTGQGVKIRGSIRIISPKDIAYVRIYLVTWNVHGKSPRDDLTDMLQLQASTLPEIYGIGLQEASSPEWEGHFSDALKRHNYVKVKTRRLQGILTMVFVKRSHLKYTTSIESEVTKTGFGGLWGNKGASSIRMDFMGLNLIVVNSHLAPHMEETLERILHIDSILDNQRFKDRDTDFILDHDYVFWLGDLNFRLENVSFNRAINLIREEDYGTLIQNDQLHLVMEEELVFQNFEEGLITFPPTYKFDVGTDTYDTSEKQRVPSYTDRILYFFHKTSYGLFKLHAKLIRYCSHPNYRSSDHKPVSALIEISVMTKGVSNPVTFNRYTAAQPRNLNFEIAYTVRKDFCIASGDWIALYKDDFHDLDSYSAFIYANTQAGSQTKTSVRLKARFETIQLTGVSPGSYVLCYLTKKSSLCGIINILMAASIDAFTRTTEEQIYLLPQDINEQHPIGS